MQKTILFIIFLTCIGGAIATDCPLSALDCVDIGNSDSMIVHQADRFGEDPGIGDYGGRDGGSIGIVFEPQNNACSPENNDAIITLNSGSALWDTITIRFFDTASHDDSFIVQVDDTIADQFIDGDDSQEEWTSFDFDLSNYALTGEHVVTITATGEADEDCLISGHLAVNYISVTALTEIPEFGFLAGGIALAGALVGFFILRKQ